MTRRRHAPGAVNGNGAVAPAAAAQGHTAAQALRSSLQRIAALHTDLAAAYGDLAAEAENGLAALGGQSVHASVSPELLTPGEAAKFFQVSPRHLRRMELAGEIPPAIGEGKGKRWRREDLP